MIDFGKALHDRNAKGKLLLKLSEKSSLSYVRQIKIHTEDVRFLLFYIFLNTM